MIGNRPVVTPCGSPSSRAQFETGDPVAVTDAVVDLGRLVLDFGQVERITRHPDGAARETDTTHTVMLGLIGCALAREFFPALDLGLIAQFALVHDLVEVHAGDTPTLRMPSAEAKAEKQYREHAAYERISADFLSTLPWVPLTIRDYEGRREPEARFVKALDKLLPKITHILNGAITIREEGMDATALTARYAAQLKELEGYAADFPELFDLRAALVARVADVLAQQ
jgi:putative hydrolase of HD superfamily